MGILDGIRILDMTHVWFGPYTTMQLASMGAEVIKVEVPWGEMMRMPRPDTAIGGQNPTFMYLNRNKKSVTLNLRSEEGKKVYLDLLKVSDVVIQNFSPGTMERMGLGYDVLKKANPKIIYAALSGYGQTGPYTRRRSFDIVGQAMSGLMYQTGYRQDPNGPPINTADAPGDLTPALWAVIGIMGALMHRAKTGEGQMLDVSQVDVMIAQCPSIVTYSNVNRTREELLELQQKAFTGLYGRVKAKDDWVVVGAPRGNIFDRLKKVIGIEDIQSREPIDKWIGERPVEEVLTLFEEGGVPCAPVLKPEEVQNNPHVQARNGIIVVEHSEAGPIKQPNFPVKFEKTPGVITAPSPLLGEHNEEIVTKLLGYSKEEYEALKEKRIFG